MNDQPTTDVRVVVRQFTQAGEHEAAPEPILLDDADVQPALDAVRATLPARIAPVSLSQEVRTGSLPFAWALMFARTDSETVEPGAQDGALPHPDAAKAILDAAFADHLTRAAAHDEGAAAIGARDAAALRRLLDRPARVLKDVTRAVRPCASCAGEKTVACGGCKGSGTAPCPACKGSMEVRCRHCGGKGCLACDNHRKLPCLDCGPPVSPRAGVVVCAACKGGPRPGRLSCAPCGAQGTQTVRYSMSVSNRIEFFKTSQLTAHPDFAALLPGLPVSPRWEVVVRLYEAASRSPDWFDSPPRLTRVEAGESDWAGIRVDEVVSPKHRSAPVLALSDGRTLALDGNALDTLLGAEADRVLASPDPFAASGETPLGALVAGEARDLLSGALVRSVGTDSVALRLPTLQNVPGNPHDAALLRLSSPAFRTRWRDKLVAWAAVPSRCGAFVPHYGVFVATQEADRKAEQARLAKARRARQVALARKVMTAVLPPLALVAVVVALVLSTTGEEAGPPPAAPPTAAIPPPPPDPFALPVAFPGSAVMPMPSVRPEVGDPLVFRTQTMLRHLGLMNSAADGVRGPDTIAAIQRLTALAGGADEARAQVASLFAGPPPNDLQYEFLLARAALMGQLRTRGPASTTPLRHLPPVVHLRQTRESTLRFLFAIEATMARLARPGDAQGATWSVGVPNSLLAVDVYSSNELARQDRRGCFQVTLTVRNGNGPGLPAITVPVCPEDLVRPPA